MTKKKSLAQNVHEKIKEIDDLQENIIDLRQKQREVCEMAVRSILKALNAKDHYTYGHSMRVAHLCLCTGKKMGLNAQELYDLEISALFHDIGKIGVPDSVLLKPERLDEDEFAVMKQHPEKSAEILEDFPIFSDIAKYAKHHHERFDGRGYPDQLKGEDIPLFSRIILIADTFDAMTSTRPYRKGLPYSVAFDELKEFSGSQFDPELVDTFIEAIREDESDKSKTFELSIIRGDFQKKAA